MKNKKFLIIFLIFILCLCFSSVLGAERGVFPDPARLQPPPQGVSKDIPAPIQELIIQNQRKENYEKKGDSAEFSKTENNLEILAETNASKQGQHNYFWPIIISVAIILVLFFFFKIV